MHSLRRASPLVGLGDISTDMADQGDGALTKLDRQSFKFTHDLLLLGLLPSEIGLVMVSMRVAVLPVNTLHVDPASHVFGP